MIPKNQPAHIYDLNIGASIIGRNASPCLMDDDKKKLEELMLVFADQFHGSLDNKPILVNTNEQSIKQALTFSQRVRRQMDYLRGYSRVAIDALCACLDVFDVRAQKEILGQGGLTISREQITDALDIPEILDIEQLKEILHNESVWTEKSHPSVPWQLRRKVDATQTKELIHACSHDLFGEGISVPINVYTQDTLDRHYLYWSTNSGGIDYATPSHYDLATQLSFDIPHNVAHLRHLSCAKNNSVEQYLDRTNERTYTEAIAVLAEYQIYMEAVNRGEVIQHFSEIIGMPMDELARWIEQDRSYEFRLRLARLLSDVNTINGKSFAENTTDIETQLGIPQKDAIAEAQKYYAWTGLGATYTLGYRRLLHRGIKNARNAMTLPSGDILLSWKSLLEPRQVPKK